MRQGQLVAHGPRQIAPHIPRLDVVAQRCSRQAEVVQVIPAVAQERIEAVLGSSAAVVLKRWVAVEERLNQEPAHFQAVRDQRVLVQEPKLGDGQIQPFGIRVHRQKGCSF